MLRFGTIGSGWILDEYIHGAKDSGLWELTAVYSRTAERAQAFAQKHGAPLWFTDLEEMAASPQIDAKALLANARDDAAKAAREYAIQVEQKRNELEEMKRQVSAFRVSLLEMYKKHLESINHIPSFRFKDTQPAVSRPEPQPAPQPEPEPEPQPVYREEPRPVSAPVSVPEPKPEPEPVPQPVVEQPKMEPAPQETPELPQEEPTLQDKVDYSREQLRQEPHSYHPDDNDLSQVGIDLEAYSDIPESLQREKASHFSNLEFGDDVDLGRKKRRK